jgi:hypothetical protein
VNWLVVKLAPLLVEAALDWLIEQLRDQANRKRIVSRHGAKLDAAYAHLKAARTDEEFRDAAEEVIGASWG